MIGPTLRTQRLVMRPPEPADAAAFAAFFGSARAQYLGGPEDSDSAFRRFLRIMGHWQLYYCGPFALTRQDDDKIIGMCGHWYPREFPEPDVGWMLFDDADEGQGFATEAARCALDHAWHKLKWPEAVSYIHPENLRAHKLAKRLGAARDHEAQPLMYGDIAFRVYRHAKPADAAVPA